MLHCLTLHFWLKVDAFCPHCFILKIVAWKATIPKTCCASVDTCSELGDLCSSLQANNFMHIEFVYLHLQMHFVQCLTVVTGWVYYIQLHPWIIFLLHPTSKATPNKDIVPRNNSCNSFTLLQNKSVGYKRNSFVDSTWFHEVFIYHLYFLLLIWMVDLILSK